MSPASTDRSPLDRGQDPDGSLERFVRGARHPPLWARWLLTIAAFVVLIVVIAIVVHDINSNTNDAGSAKSEAKAEAEANQEGRTVIAQDQAPRSAALRLGVPVVSALERAIAADVHKRTTDGQLTGPYESVRCRATGPPRAGRQPFSCTVESAHVEYPFAGVADTRTRELSWCKVDPPPEPGAPLEVPLSPRCRA